MKTTSLFSTLASVVKVTKYLFPAFLLVLAVFRPLEAGAVAFRLPSQDPEAVARGNAFAATADNPSAIYYNPAGITQLEGNNVRLGLYTVSAGVDYTSTGGQTASTKCDPQPVPEVYYVFSPKDCPVSLGLGIYAPYGLGVDWGENPPFRQVAQKGKVLYASFNPVVAVEITKSLSVGIGPTINYSEASFKRGVFGGTDRFEFRGDGTAYGFNAGLRWQPCDQLAFGINYRYETEVEYEGVTQIDPYIAADLPTHGSVLYPQFAVMGVSYRPTTNWNFEFNADWTDWDSVNEIVFYGTPGNQALQLNYTSSWMYEFGITRQLGDGYFASVGYFFSENSSPDAEFNPLVADSDLHLGSVGFGRRGKHWDWAVVYHFGYNAERVVSGSNSADGSYKTFNQVVTAAVGFKF